jgi:hypothetical protein
MDLLERSCEAEFINECKGHLTPYSFRWYLVSRKNSNWIEDTKTLTCNLCSHHYNLIVRLNGNEKPTVCGYDTWDALDDLLNKVDKYQAEQEEENE